MLKIKLYTEGKYLIYRILHQDESLRSKYGHILNYGRLSHSFTSSNGWTISSYANLGIDVGARIIWLRGYESDYDDEIVFFNCGDESRAKELKESLLEAFRDFSERGYFFGKKDDENGDETHVYSFE